MLLVSQVANDPPVDLCQCGPQGQEFNTSYIAGCSQTRAPPPPMPTKQMEKLWVCLHRKIAFQASPLEPAIQPNMEYGDLLMNSNPARFVPLPTSI
jgi:hypothetical protein